MKVLTGGKDPAEPSESHAPVRVSMVIFEVAVLVGHHEGAESDAVIKAAKDEIGGRGQIRESSDRIELDEDSAAEEWGVDINDGVDCVTPALIDEYSGWTVRQFINDTTEDAHNRAMAKRQMGLFQGKP